METTNIIENLLVASEVLAAVIGFIGVAIMFYGAAKGICYFAVFTKRHDDLLIEIRIDLAKHLSLGLEFLVAKDIIETIVRPTQEHLVALIGIVVIRTFISHMLSREIRDAAQELAGETEFEEALERYDKAQQKNRHLHQL